ncbi:hypothetical protein E2562_030828, partial [Oryza meyeriana var. granulata]
MAMPAAAAAGSGEDAAADEWITHPWSEVSERVAELDIADRRLDKYFVEMNGKRVPPPAEGSQVEQAWLGEAMARNMAAGEGADSTGAGRRHNPPFDRVARARALMLTAAAPIRKVNIFRVSLLVCTVTLLISGVGSAPTQDLEFNRTDFCPAGLQFKRPMPSFGLLLGSETPLYKQDKCIAPSLDKQVFTTIGSILAFIANLGPMKLAMNFEEVYIGRKLCLILHCLFICEGNMHWLFYLFIYKCWDKWTMFLTAGAFGWHLLYCLFFFMKSSLKAMHYLLIGSVFALLGIICYDNGLAHGALGLFFITLAHTLRVISTFIAKSYDDCAMLLAICGAGNGTMLYKLRLGDVQNLNSLGYMKIGSLVSFLSRCVEIFALLFFYCRGDGQTAAHQAEINEPLLSNKVVHGHHPQDSLNTVSSNAISAHLSADTSTEPTVDTMNYQDSFDGLHSQEHAQAPLMPPCPDSSHDAAEKPGEIYVDGEDKLTLHGQALYYIKLKEAEKNTELNNLLDGLKFNKVVIFVKSASRASEVNNLLCERNFPVISIHCGMTQEERLTQHKNFEEGHKRILVATDNVGWGIDVELVNIVINYDMPDSAELY